MVKDEDFEVTNILDPDLKDKKLALTEEDIDLELDEALSSRRGEKPPPPSLNDEATLVMSVETGRAPGENEDEVDFELINPLNPPAPAAAVEEAADFGPDEPIRTEAPIGVDDEEVEFELEDILAEEPLPELPLDEDESDEVEPDLDFEFEEVVEEPAATRTEPWVETEAPAAGPESYREEATGSPLPDSEARTATLRELGAPVSDQDRLAVQEETVEKPAEAGLDAARLEAVIENAVRETVSQVMERILPGLVEEAVARELEKLRLALEED